MLTAADVEQKTFSTALRGYDLDEVDDFLDEVVSTIKELSEKLEEARSAQMAAPVPSPELEAVAPEAETPEAEAPEPEVVSEPEPEKAAAPAIDESAVGRALIAAQAAADKLLEDAESQASRMLEDAKEEADTWETEKEAKKVEAQAEMANLAERVRSVRSELAVLASHVSGNLDEMDSVIASSGVDNEDDGSGDDIGDDANQVTILDTDDSDDSDGNEAETGVVDTDTANGADHLDQILTGVAADLQIGEPDDDSEADEYEDDETGEYEDDETGEYDEDEERDD